MNTEILVDVDDTLNDMTGNMCESFAIDMERITFNDILSGNNPNGFQEHRLQFLSNIDNWGCEPHGVGASIIPMIKKTNFKAVICTKTPTKVGSFDVAAEKVKFQQKHYPSTDMLIVVGDKSVVAARGIIDDLTGNCLKHNAKHKSAYLVFEHNRTTEEHIKMFLKMCKHKPVVGNEAALVVVKYGNNIVKFQRADGEVALPCGKVDKGETFEQAARRELHEETGIELSNSETLTNYGTMTTKTGWTVGVFFIDLSERPVLELKALNEFSHEGNAFLGDNKIGEVGDENYEFNNILIHNMKID